MNLSQVISNNVTHTCSDCIFPASFEATHKVTELHYSGKYIPQRRPLFSIVFDRETGCHLGLAVVDYPESN